MGASTSLGSICNNVVYFMINCIFLDGAYTLLGSICNNIVMCLMINCTFSDGSLYFTRTNMQSRHVFQNKLHVLVGGSCLSRINMRQCRVF